MNESNLRNLVNEFCPILPAQRYHGFRHMRNVEAFGDLLAKRTEGVDNDVVHWFAYLHDIERKKDYDDPDHGKRVPAFIDLIRNTYLIDLTNEQIELLKKACELHNSTHKTGNPTIDVCFDADRLDLPRFGIKTDPGKMATQLGMDLAKEKYESLCLFVESHLRDRLIFSDKYIAKNYKIGNLALRFNINMGGFMTSPFDTTIWRNDAKSVCSEGWYKKSGIYAFPYKNIDENNIYYYLAQKDHTILSLLEYEFEELRLGENFKMEKPKEYVEKMTSENPKGAELLLDYLERNNYIICFDEICLRSCNIVFSAPFNEFFERFRTELIEYSQKKCDAYIEAKSRLDNFGNSRINDLLLGIPELPSVKL